MVDTESNHCFKKKELCRKREGQGKEAAKFLFPCGVNKTKQNLCFEIKQNPCLCLMNIPTESMEYGQHAGSETKDLDRPTSFSGLAAVWPGASYLASLSLSFLQLYLQDCSEN